MKLPLASLRYSLLELLLKSFLQLVLATFACFHFVQVVL